MKTIIIPNDASGTRLSTYLSDRGISISAPCGGRGVCKKCRVRVISGQFTAAGQPLTPDNDGFILACQAICAGEAEIELPDSSGDGLTVLSSAKLDGSVDTGVGIALDIGTTTLAAALVEHGKVTTTVSCLNPQQSFGADVISRIEACKNGKLHAMQACLISAIRDMTDKLLADLSPELRESCELTVAGNTTMLHIFCGISPEGMGSYPFTPVFLDARVLTGESLGLPFKSIKLLPSVSAFVGSDITAGMLVCGLGQSDAPILLLDIGTNGEMVLDTGSSGGNRLLATSTAAGPALEGANISCGTGGVPGAVSKVAVSSRTPESLEYRTIGDKPACGICGCGLVDLCSCLLDMELLDETGYLYDDPYVLTGIHKTSSDDGAAAETTICLSQKDIRELQLAKSAIRAGIEALLSAADMDTSSFTESGGKVYIAGGLGYYLDPVNAASIGLLPPEFIKSPEIVQTPGNTALSGAICALYNDAVLDEMTHLAKHCETVDLSVSQVFNDGFIEYMMFPEKE